MGFTSSFRVFLRLLAITNRGARGREGEKEELWLEDWRGKEEGRKNRGERLTFGEYGHGVDSGSIAQSPPLTLQWNAWEIYTGTGRTITMTDSHRITWPPALHHCTR